MNPPSLVFIVLPRVETNRGKGSGGDILNFNCRLPGTAASVRGNILILMAILRRAFGGSMARKLRAVLPDFGLKGEKDVEIEVRNRVIILLADMYKYSRRA